MQTETTRAQMFENIIAHINVLNQALMNKQMQMLASSKLPAETLREIHYKALQYGQAITWLKAIAQDQFSDFLPKNGKESKIITE